MKTVLSTLLVIGLVSLLALAVQGQGDTEPTATPPTRQFGPLVTPPPNATEPVNVQPLERDESTSTPAPTRALPTPLNSTAGPTPQITPGAVNSRLAVCNAPTLPGFVAYTMRPGDRLANLLIGSDTLTPAQLAALNCIDDPAALPVGATIWLPAASAAVIANLESLGAEAAVGSGAQTPIIDSLSGDVDPVPNLEGVTVSWQASGNAAYFYLCPPDPAQDCRRPAGAQPLPLAHSLILNEFKYAGPTRYRLEVRAGSTTATEDLTFEVACSQEALGAVSGPALCPEEPPRAVFAVGQPFEGGVMLYFSDTEEILVLTADGRVRVFPDEYVEEIDEPEMDEVPEGRFPAIRGFGLVWRALDAAEGDLGWALAEESGFDSARQPAGRLSYTTYILGPNNVVYAVTRIPNTDVGYWAQIAR